MAGPTLGVIVGEAGVIIAVARGDEFLRTIEVAEDPPTKPGSRLPAPLAAAVDVMGSMSFELAIQIEKVRITPEGELVFELGDDRTVLFGTVADADKKLLTAKTMLGPQIDNSGLCQLDVRVPTAPTIRRKPACDPPPPPVVDPAAVDPASIPPWRSIRRRALRSRPFRRRRHRRRPRPRPPVWIPTWATRRSLPSPTPSCSFRPPRSSAEEPHSTST